MKTIIIILVLSTTVQAEILLKNSPIYETDSKGEIIAVQTKDALTEMYSQAKVLATLKKDYRLIEYKTGAFYKQIIVHKDSLLEDGGAKFYGTIDSYKNTKSIKVGYLEPLEVKAELERLDFKILEDYTAGKFFICEFSDRIEMQRLQVIAKCPAVKTISPNTQAKAIE